MQRIKVSRRHGLDKHFAGLVDQVGPRPSEGWIRLLRSAIGMSPAQLALRMGITPRRVRQLEQAEIQGRIVLSTLDRAAEAMHCRLFYVLVPELPLNEIVRRQARLVAEAEFRARGEVPGASGLEVGPDEDEWDALVEARVYELVDSSALWKPLSQKENRTPPGLTGLRIDRGPGGGPVSP